jgi:hypothetical protein
MCLKDYRRNKNSCSKNSRKAWAWNRNYMPNQSAKNFTSKDLVESLEIQESYDLKDYFNAVLKCRVFLESWLSEYILALLFPEKGAATKENRQFVSQRFADMFYQIQWLHQGNHITKNDYDNLNKIRIFSENVFRKNDVLTIYTIKELDNFVSASIHYCQKFRNSTKRLIENTPARAL